ncbi:hypothetical protein LTR57_013945 [Friedmanniomyces endolithicus]|nr:hypothetical protein LTR75_003524 [Friedmanniomyces endolithicus]KAK0914502.1 hypothetical protein LTR57_013945 [Friedmanniomyces endolithicus]KAK0976508.1 hypothetical protein LTS01_013440 [Friedmanniomyces endolithicus]
MRTSLPRTLRQLSRNATRLNVSRCRASGARWSSTGSEDEGHKWSTPLAKQLTEAITTTGPIPVASYMRQCLTSDLGGYYTATAPSETDQFGARGDFVTSPEISQIFGELIGLWVVAEWIAQGRRSAGVYLMEMGPGRGTLMDDMLRTIRNFPPLAKAIEAVYLVEASRNLRLAQHKLLCGGNPLSENGTGHESTSRYSKDLKIIWTEDIRFVPREASKTPFIIAHEFFDALPIHVFQSVPPAPPPSQKQQQDTIQTPTGPIPSPRRIPKTNEWRELVVSPKPPHRLKTDEPEFELTMAKAATPHSMYLPEISPRYQALKSTDGATIEISPESQAYTLDFAIRIGGSNPAPLTQPEPPRTATSAPLRPVAPARKTQPFPKPRPSGAALIIDYGPPSTIPANSLRGIKAHSRVSPFLSPGTTDVSADVDFLALAEAAVNGSPGVEVHGPVSQGRFLGAMGIRERAGQLVERAKEVGMGGKGGEGLGEVVERVESGWRRLVDLGPQGMGGLYQVMAFVPFRPVEEGEVRRRPVGFGGDVRV